MNAAKKRRIFTLDEKRAAISELDTRDQTGKTAEQIALEVGTSPANLYYWSKTREEWDRDEPATPKQRMRRAAPRKRAKQSQAEDPELTDRVMRELDAMREIALVLLQAAPDKRLRILEAVCVIQGFDDLADQIRQKRGLA